MTVNSIKFRQSNYFKSMPCFIYRTALQLLLFYLQKYEELSADPYGDTGDDEDTALTGVSNMHFKYLKPWFVKVIIEHKVTSMHSLYNNSMDFKSSASNTVPALTLTLFAQCMHNQ